jgi:Ca2+-binding RTX toxin-like protein
MRRPSTARLRLAALEARDVPTAAALDHGTLTITGTAGKDSIWVYESFDHITIGGMDGYFEVSQVNLIRVNPCAGDDQVMLDSAGFEVTKPAVILGGDGDDVLHGGLAADYIDGEAGNDWVYGSGGADKLAGDTGDDCLNGNAGNDSLAGGAGLDVLYGNSGVDHLWGGTDFDYVEGGSGKDHVYDDLLPLAVQVNDTSYVHHHILGFADNSGFGWFDANMPDADLRRQARAAARNNYLGRAETIALLEQATDGTTVTTNEFTSLKNVVNTDQVRFDAPARYFGQKVMNGDPANQWFTGGGTRHALGNLHAGDSDTHLQRLIDKWFLGKDHPLAQTDDRATTFDYQAAAGQLFVGGAKPTDVVQGQVGDCGFLAALGAVARKNSSRITGMFTANGDETYTVRLYRDGHPEYVTVDGQLPVDDQGRIVFAGTGHYFADNAGNELWVALTEKAYAQANESGWLGQDGTNSYNGLGGQIDPDDNFGGLNGVFPADALNHLTGSGTSGGWTSDSTFTDVKAAFDTGKAVVFSSKLNPVSPDVVEAHGYMMVGYDATHHTVTLRNPWGDGNDQPAVLTVSVAFLKANFDSWVAAKA